MCDKMQTSNTKGGTAMPKRKKKKSAKVDYKTILVSALADLAVGALLILIDKLIN